MIEGNFYKPVDEKRLDDGSLKEGSSTPWATSTRTT